MKLFRNSKVHPEQDAFEEAFAGELVITEQLRVRLMMLLFVGAPILFVAFRYIMPETYFRLFKTAEVWQWMTIFGLGGVLYEMVIRWTVLPKIATDYRRHNWLRYVNTFEETLIPTAGIYMISLVIGPTQALLSPSAEIYYLFIVVSVLRLDHRICLFAGAMAALQYILLSLYLLPQSELTGASVGVLVEPLFFIDRGMMMLICGCGAAFVTYRYREVIENALSGIMERNRIVGIFGQHVSPQVVNKLLEQQAVQDSEQRDVCVMFLDIRDFTSYSENKAPEDVVEFLNTLFDFMIEVVNANHGIINKFLGDGFMAIFGAPLSTGQDCHNAVSASIEMVEELNRRIGAGEIPPVRIGIGLHTGSAVTGNVGSHQRKEYTIIGDVVNTASRIEQLNKQYESQILISLEVWDQLASRPDHITTYSDVKVKGRESAIEIYQLA